MSLAAGKRLGPYEVVELLGAGGMGAVYRARDPRLGRDVAVKVLADDIASDPDRLRRFEQEARAVAALNHPNILSVYDVGTQPADQRTSPGTRSTAMPYVVTELLEGETLREVLNRRSPTQRQILGWAVQTAQGLAAAHQKGILHRDLKPENLFLTTEGRLKILDFGLAKQTSATPIDSAEETEAAPTRPGVVMGTVAYMSPEQVQALAVDARSDIFSFGVVLYELLAKKHPFRHETATVTVGAILQETPQALTSLDATIPRAVDGIVRRCLEKKKEDRFQGAHDLGLALEAVLAAPTGSALLDEVEERSPYPGLSSFTERDASVFFGREGEVTALWERIRSHKLLAVIGPSGAGKTSFLRAGVIPARPEGWAAIVATPGTSPMRSLARALAPALAKDAEALGTLPDFDEPDVAVALLGRWSRAHGDALLVLDQFEELFTLNLPETQQRFAALLTRLAREADVHVVLSLRDDFLMRCHEQAPLAPVFEGLTPLGALTAEGLRRALVEPARKPGYRFEDEGLVDEMVESVEGARAALPLLAFAVSRLWEKRDRERRFLTRDAYQEIGGVAGALAQHAEATLDEIGVERQGLVREIFRNVVTAQGTRAVIDRDELLSAFPERAAAEDVLRQLIDARLLTSYEMEGREGEPSHHRVEIVHESLLRAWPRLVRWQAQDEEGSLLRDQLKQAAHLWDEKGRTSDLLWTGTAYQEFELWRGRYAGALTVLEDDFARSMADKARRRKRLITAGVASVIFVLAGVAMAVTFSRHQAVLARERSEASARRAEASKLLALAKLEIDRYPTAALAYARKSLDLADTPEARRFAVEVLWRSPVARILPLSRMARQAAVPDRVGFEAIALSPDGRWLATEAPGGWVLLFPPDGGLPRSLAAPLDGHVYPSLGFAPQSDVLVAGGAGRRARFLSIPDLREIRSIDLGGVDSWGSVLGDRLLTLTRMSKGDTRPLFRSWALPGGELKTQGRRDWLGSWDVDRTFTRLAFARGREIVLRTLDPSRPTAEQVLGRAQDTLQDLVFVRGGNGVVSIDKAGEVRLWSLDKGGASRVLGSSEVGGSPYADASGRHLAVARYQVGVDLWDLLDPPDTEPVTLKIPEGAMGTTSTFDSGGRWLVTNFNGNDVAFWPLSGPSVHRFRAGKGSWTLSFSPDSRWLASCDQENVRLWPLGPADEGKSTLLPANCTFGVALDPAGTHVVVGTFGGEVLLYAIAGGPPRRLMTGWEGATFNGTGAVAFDAEGRRVAASPWDMNPSIRDPKLRVLRVWELESGQARTYSLAHLTDDSWWGFYSISFAPDGSLYAAGRGGVSRLRLPIDQGGTASSEIVYSAWHARVSQSHDGQRLLVSARQSYSDHADELLVRDLAAGVSRRITTHGQRLHGFPAFDPTGHFIVTGDLDGVVRIGPATGEEPHLLLGGTAPVGAVAVSPDGRWVAAADEVGVRLWPMPDMTKPPLHTLAHDELIAQLDALTNLRLVPDPSSAAGWKLEVGPFPGWKDVPTW